jgi:hypothetical protein
MAQHCGTFIRPRLGPLSTITLGGFFLFAALLLFKNSDVLYRPVRGSASTISINNVVFSLDLFVAIFACNLAILAIKKSATGEQADIQMALALAATLYGAGIVFLCIFGFNGKFVAALGIGDLPDCTISGRSRRRSNPAWLQGGDTRGLSFSHRQRRACSSYIELRTCDRSESVHG